MSCLDPHPLCAHYQRTERVWFKDFILGKAKRVWDSLCPTDAISLIGGMRINKGSCVSCLLCAAFCPNASIAFDKDLRAYIVELHNGKSCLAAFLELEGKKSVKLPPDLLRGTAKNVIEDVERYNISSLTIRLEKFIKHTSVDFYGLIRWAGNALNYITTNQNGKVGYGIKIEGAKREIRLEMCHLVDEALTLWKFDNKINFGFIDRFMIGRERAKVTVNSMDLRKSIYGCYLVGENELNYYSPSEGIEGSIENRLRDYKLLMFSSTALWFLVALKLFLKKRILWPVLLKELTEMNKNYLITLDKECIQLIQRNTV